MAETTKRAKKSTPKKVGEVRAISSFIAAATGERGEFYVALGTVLPADDPLVSGRAELFVDVED